MGLFFGRRKSYEEKEEERYGDLYEEYYGRRPTGKLTEEEKEELDIFDEEEWDEIDGEE